MKYPRQVYAITHNETKRTYVGSSEDVCRRYREHIHELRRGRHRVEDMQADYSEYGENYTLTILDRIESEKDVAKEYEWMSKKGTHIRGKGYNYKDPYWKKAAEPVETEIIKLIRSSSDPKAAFLVAIVVATKFLGADEVLSVMKV